VSEYRPASEGPDPAGLIWRVRRCRENPFLCLLVMIFQFVLALAVYIYHGPEYGAIVFVGLFIALLPFYGSYRYELSPDGLKVFGPAYYVEYPWTEFDGWRLYEEELRLIFNEKKSRSVLVLYAPRRIEQVLRYVQRCLPGIKPEDWRL